MTYVTALADAIVTFLGTCALGEGITIARRRLVTATLEEMTDTTVSVIPFGTGRTQDAMGVQDVSPDVRIVVQRKLAAGLDVSDNAEADAVAKLAEDIAAFLVGQILVGCECQSAKSAPSYDPAKMSELNVFDATIHTLWSTIEDGP